MEAIAILPRLRFAGWFARPERVDPPDADGWVRAEVRFDTVEEAVGYVLGFGPQIEVLEPAELRERVIEQARQVIAFYAGRP